MRFCSHCAQDTHKVIHRATGNPALAPRVEPMRQNQRPHDPSIPPNTLTPLAPFSGLLQVAVQTPAHSTLGDLLSMMLPPPVIWQDLGLVNSMDEPLDEENCPALKKQVGMVSSVISDKLTLIAALISVPIDFG